MNESSSEGSLESLIVRKESYESFLLYENYSPITESSESFVLQEKESVQMEMKEQIEKEVLVNEARVMLYEKLGIDFVQENNSSIENFLKGIVDEMILGNYDLAIEVINTRGAIILDMLKQIFTLEGLNNILKGIGESIGDLFTGDAYEKGKSVAELGLVFVGGYGAFRLTKFGMKGLSKTRINKKNIVKSKEMKNTISQVEGKVIDVVPKQTHFIEANIVKELTDSINKKSLNSLDELGGVEQFQTKLQDFSQKLGLKEPLTVEKNYMNSGDSGAIFSIPEKKIDGTEMIVKMKVAQEPIDIDILRKDGISEAEIQDFLRMDKYIKSTVEAVSEVEKHKIFYNLLQEWKTKVYKEFGEDTYVPIDIPKVKDFKGYHLIQNLKDYDTLDNVLRKEFLTDKLTGKLRNFDFDTLTPTQASILSKEFGILPYEHIKFVPEGLKFMDKKDFDLARKFFLYSNLVGVRHRDLGLSNILIHKNPMKRKGLCVIDFGGSDCSSLLDEGVRKDINMGHLNDNGMGSRVIGDLEGLDSVQSYIVKGI